MIRWGRRIVAVGVLLYALTCALVYGTHLRAVAQDPVLHQPVRVAIVLGGGVRPDGRISHSSRKRVLRAVAAVGSRDGAMLVMTGGRRAGTPARISAELMRDEAVAQGVARGRIVTETASQTTFGNLVLSLPIADRLGAAPDGRGILLVTDSTHVLRSRMLAHFLGRPGVQVIASNSFADYRIRGRVLTILREAGACWYNLARAAAWTALDLAGVPAAERLGHAG